ncbi:MAG: hypothetical protein K8R50_00570 [Betaproteobacteria bacterium]|nr:hypothetical protein [Betaproteobacteria bacterium]
MALIKVFCTILRACREQLFQWEWLYTSMVPSFSESNPAPRTALCSLARTVLGDMGHRWEVLEAMLSHALVNQTAAAYVRTSYFEKRRGNMQQWADYLAKVEAGAEVIPLRA